MTTLPDTSTKEGQREASVMLAELRGWDVSYGLIDSDQSWDGFAHDTLTITTETGEWCDNLYDPANMAPAWMILNRANGMKFGGDTTLDHWQWWHNFIADMRLLPPAQAQRAWLDKILQLSIEAGMV